MSASHTRSCRTCGWSVTSKTPGIADRSKRQHSCEKQLATKSARLRREHRELMIDRTPKACLHKNTIHVHGTYACYVLDFCRCEPCAEANRVYEAERNRQQAYGRWNGLIDAEPVREHVRRLTAAGMGLKPIAAAAGVNGGVMCKLMYGVRENGVQVRPPARRVRPATAERILAVELQLADGAKVDGSTTARRLQALVALGWSGSKLAARLGLHPSNFTPMLHGRRKVTYSTAKAVHYLYRELADTPPAPVTHRDRISVARARNQARDNEWAPPLRINGRVHIGPVLDLADDEEERRASCATRGRTWDEFPQAVTA